MTGFMKVINQVSFSETEDVHDRSCLMGDLNGHLQEWLGSTTTNCQGVAIIDFDQSWQTFRWHRLFLKQEQVYGKGISETPRYLACSTWCNKWSAFSKHMEYCSAVWCSAADTHLKLLDRVVSVSRYLTRGMLDCDIAHRRSVSVLYMLYKNSRNPMHPLYFTSVFFWYHEAVVFRLIGCKSHSPSLHWLMLLIIIIIWLRVLATCPKGRCLNKARIKRVKAS